MAFRFRLKRLGAIAGSRLKGGHALKGLTPDTPPVPPRVQDMSVLGVPLSVRLVTSRRDLHVSGEVVGLRFRSQIPGGFTSAELTFNRTLKYNPDEVEAFGEVIIYDARSGDTVWQGRIDDTGRGLDAGGESFRIRAVGPAAHARDRQLPLIYIDSSWERWVRSSGAQNHADGIERPQEDQGGSGNLALHLQLPNQAVISSGDYVGRRYRPLFETGQKLGRINYQFDAGRTDANFSVVLASRTGAGAPTDRRTDAFTTAGVGLNYRRTITHFAAADDIADIIIRSSVGSGGLGGETFWASVFNMTLIAAMFNADGTTWGATQYAQDYLLPHEVVADLLGRLLGEKIDGAGASIDTSSAQQITQLQYLGGTTAADVLDDLMALVDYYWAAWDESKTATGKARFEWRAWPATVRYTASPEAGLSSPAPGFDVFNQVAVRYVASNGKTYYRTRTQTVPELDNVGLTRQYLLDLGDQAALSAAQADAAGDQFLAEHRYAPNRGSLEVKGPIWDAELGRNVQPWEIRPGGLLRLLNVVPSAASASATARDGVTVFRLVGVEYSADDNTARLDLDAPPLTVERSLAGLTSSKVKARK